MPAAQRSRYAVPLMLPTFAGSFAALRLEPKEGGARRAEYCGAQKAPSGLSLVSRCSCIEKGLMNSVKCGKLLSHLVK
jgi:hypothetical protein